MKYTLLLLLIISSLIFSQNQINSNRLHSDFAEKESRKLFKTELQNNITNVFSSELNTNNEKMWIKLFKEIGLLLYKNDEIKNAVDKACEYSEQSSIKFKRALAEIIITLYPNDYSLVIDSLFVNTNDPTLFAYCAEYYMNNRFKKEDDIITETKQRFNNWERIPQLKFLVYNIENKETQTPQLKDIINHNFIKGKTIIYSFQRKNRKYPGITIIKKPNGEFVRTENDSIFYVKQMALSVTNLPGYLSQGNTPQGIFSVVGFYNSTTP